MGTWSLLESSSTAEQTPSRNAVAQSAYRRATALHPRTHATAWNNLGRSYHADHRWSEAGEAYFAAVSVAPTYAIAFYNLGLWHGAAPAGTVGSRGAAGAASCFRQAASAALLQRKLSVYSDSLAKLADVQMRASFDSKAASRSEALITSDSLSQLAGFGLSGDPMASHQMSAFEQMEEASSALQRLSELRPSDSHAKGMLGYAKKQLEKMKK